MVFRHYPQEHAVRLSLAVSLHHLVHLVRLLLDLC